MTSSSLAELDTAASLFEEFAPNCRAAAFNLVSRCAKDLSLPKTIMTDYRTVRNPFKGSVPELMKRSVTLSRRRQVR
jgi:hypothetical protein